MKNFIYTAALLALTHSAFAGKLRVNNNVGVVAPYSSLPAAITAASVGDTIYIDPSPTDYGGITINKALTLIGNGYFSTAVTSNNPGLQAKMQNTPVSSITITANNVTVSGLASNSIHLSAVSNCVVERCYLSTLYISNWTGSAYINISNNTIRQNLFYGSGIYTYSFSTNSNTVAATNTLIHNNIIYASHVNLPAGISGAFINNTWEGAGYYMNVLGFQVNNNIFNSYSIAANNNVFFNNIATNTQIPSGNGNQQNVVWNTIYAMTPNGTDSSYVHSATGPAAGTGFNNVDCGAYGGATPYRKSGIPPFPTIYQLSAPATTTTNTLPVTISTRSNN